MREIIICTKTTNEMINSIPEQGGWLRDSSHDCVAIEEIDSGFQVVSCNSRNPTCTTFEKFKNYIAYILLARQNEICVKTDIDWLINNIMEI